MTTPTLSIDGNRLWQSLMDLARIGATPKGGNCRLALTALDGQGRGLPAMSIVTGAGHDTVYMAAVARANGAR